MAAPKTILVCKLVGSMVSTASLDAGDAAGANPFYGGNADITVLTDGALPDEYVDAGVTRAAWTLVAAVPVTGGVTFYYELRPFA